MVSIMDAEKRSSMEDEYIRRHHKHDVKENQCSSSLVKHIKAPVHLVFSVSVCVFIYLFFFYFISSSRTFVLWI